MGAFFVLLYLGYKTVMTGGYTRNFTCSADILIEDKQQQASLHIRYSIIMMRNNTAMIDAICTVEKENISYPIAKHVYFIYVKNQPEGVIYLQKVGEEEGLFTVDTANEVFNRLMFNNKMAFSLKVTPLGQGTYEIRVTDAHVVVCHVT